MKKPPIGILKFLLALVLEVVFLLLGLECRKAHLYNEGVFLFLFLFALILPLVAFVINLVLAKRFKDSFDSEATEKSFLEQKAAAKETREKKLPLLKKLIVIGDIYAASVAFFGCLLAFAAGGLGQGTMVPWYLFALVYIFLGLDVIRLGAPKVNFNTQTEYLLESDYPILHSIAYRAASCLGCEGKIKIAVSHDFNASIGRFTDAYSVVLGTYLLDNLSEEELFNVLLHEFAHVSEENATKNYVMYYFDWINEPHSMLDGLITLLYRHIRMMYSFEYTMYMYACSVINEEEADEAMLKFGNSEVAASSLLKTKFSNMYDWERGTYEEEHTLKPERMAEDYVRRQLRAYKERMELRKDAWVEMIDSEILARNASHPTVKMRITSLGIEEPRLVEKNDTPEYLAEVEKAICHIEKVIHYANLSNYQAVRQHNYLSHVQVLEEWENKGRAIVREEYADVLYALFCLGKVPEFVNLCYQIIEEMPEPTNYYAHHMLGCYLLRTYNEEGIDHLYKSIELNHNMWEEAIDTIGRYACIVGKQDKLNEYRRRAKEIVKKDNEIYQNMNFIGPKDKLLSEQLPEGMLDDFIGYIKSIENSTIDKIYMVRKIIDEENFVTCVVVSPTEKADNDKFLATMEKIYQYLDKSSDWQYSLFDMRRINKRLILRVKDSCIYRDK